MQDRIICALALVPLLLLVGCAADTRDHTKASVQRDEENGFVRLFNGRDLTGWVYGTSKGVPRKAGNGYQVRQDDAGGVLYCTATDGGNLFTEKEYSDFVLRFDFRLTPGANNGVGIRSPMEGQTAYQGIEIQVLDDTSEKYAKLRPAQYHGSVYDVFPAERGHLKPVGEWNSEEISAHGPHVQVKLNGHTIVDANLDAVTDEAVLKKHPGLKRKSGHIGLLGHGSEVEFRNVRIKELR